MAIKLTRKRALISGSALLLIAGISAGGATLTQNSTIVGNTFGIEAAPVENGEVTVTGPQMNHDFVLDYAIDYSHVRTYEVTNFDDAKEATVTVLGNIHDYGTDPEVSTLADSLIATVVIDNQSYGKHTLADLMDGQTFTVPADSVKKAVIRVTAPSSDETPWHPEVSEDTKVVVDWQFVYNHK